MKIIILGPTGSGKGTQAKFIAKLLKLDHIEVGAHFRKMSRRNKYIRNILDKGDLVPDRIVIKLVKRLVRNKENYILDGFPRKLSQAKSFKDKVDLVLFLNVNKNDIIKRLLLRRREDDNLKNIKERYKVYLKQTIPVLNYYKRLGILIKINGNPPIKDVSKNIKKILMDYFPKLE